MEFFTVCFKILGEDFLKVVEYSISTRRKLVAYNSTFITLIPKIDNPSTFKQFRPISLCNNIYIIITKLTAQRLKYILSTLISAEQFRFLQGLRIHKAIGLAQEIMHSIPTSNHKSITLKVDLSKAFDRVIWLYLKLILIHLVFYHSFITWVMN